MEQELSCYCWRSSPWWQMEMEFSSLFNAVVKCNVTWSHYLATAILLVPFAIIAPGLCMSLSGKRSDFQASRPVDKCMGATGSRGCYGKALWSASRQKSGGSGSDLWFPADSHIAFVFGEAGRENWKYQYVTIALCDIIIKSREFKHPDHNQVTMGTLQWPKLRGSILKPPCSLPS